MKRHSRFFLALAFLTLTSNPCLAWDGIDMKRNASIEITTGNLVREGSFIDFYDSSDGNYHTAKVISVSAISHGTEVVVEDLTEKHQQRTFIMQEQN